MAKGRFGDRIQGLLLNIYKLRIRNSSVGKGKSAGFRVIYYLKDQELIYVLAVYSKGDRGDVSKKEITKIIKSSDPLV